MENLHSHAHKVVKMTSELASNLNAKNAVLSCRIAKSLKNVTFINRYTRFSENKKMRLFFENKANVMVDVSNRIDNVRGFIVYLLSAKTNCKNILKGVRDFGYDCEVYTQNGQNFLVVATEGVGIEKSKSINLCGR